MVYANVSQLDVIVTPVKSSDVWWSSVQWQSETRITPVVPEQDPHMPKDVEPPMTNEQGNRTDLTYIQTVVISHGRVK